MISLKRHPNEINVTNIPDLIGEMQDLHRLNLRGEHLDSYSMQNVLRAARKIIDFVASDQDDPLVLFDREMSYYAGKRAGLRNATFERSQITSLVTDNGLEKALVKNTEWKNRNKNGKLLEARRCSWHYTGAIALNGRATILIEGDVYRASAKQKGRPLSAVDEGTYNWYPHRRNLIIMPADSRTIDPRLRVLREGFEITTTGPITEGGMDEKIVAGDINYRHLIAA